MAPASSLLFRHCSSTLFSPLPRGASGSRFFFCSNAIRSQELRNPNYGRNPSRCWDQFYKRHHNKFFKDRHYLEKDWGRYFTSNVGSEKEQSHCDQKVVLEVGCGVGNTLFPLLAAFPYAFLHACDFSPHAIGLIKAHEAFRNDRVNAFLCDVTTDDLCNKIMPASVDVVTLIFMLSAVSPTKMPYVLQNIKRVLKPSGCLLFRDYARGDFAQEKLSRKDQMISENFYVRGDGTCAHFFTKELLSTLFTNNGFNTLEVSIYCKEIVNRSQNVFMDRRWIRAAFCLDHPDSQQSLPMILT